MPATRLAVLDLFRGLAVVAMAAYHLSWDLSWFAFVSWPVSQGSGWRTFAMLIAGSFLFVSGISLDLAHRDRIRWRSFFVRLAKIVLAAAAVSIVTYFTFGDNFVRFGVLHAIAASSLIALPFTRLPFWASILAAAFIFSMPTWAASGAFDGQFLLWTGLGTPAVGSVDYVPLVPWAGVALAGLAISRAFRIFGVWEKLSAFRFNGLIGQSTRFLGRHSLPIYLLHQPVLYGLVWMAALLGPDFDQGSVSFVRSCTQACKDNGGTPDICEAACACTLDNLKADKIWTPLNEDPQNQSLRARMNDRYAQCMADPQSRPLTSGN
ncbi:DUF1624 domain-containing protein [Rhodobacterales bacterium]|nr:DUF1624 domain-containing protein [Rhodobacterales bacterium]